MRRPNTQSAPAKAWESAAPQVRQELPLAESKLVDELAAFAAELWFAGRLDDFPLRDEETDDADLE